MRRLFIAILVTLVSAPVAVAAQRVSVCAKYQADYGWSKGYAVQATVLTGTELNQATNSFDYNGFSTYVVIFWEQHEASIIEMSISMPLSVVDEDGVDQRGVKWEISQGGICD